MQTKLSNDVLLNDMKNFVFQLLPTETQMHNDKIDLIGKKKKLRLLDWYEIYLHYLTSYIAINSAFFSFYFATKMTNSQQDFLRFDFSQIIIVPYKFSSLNSCHSVRC